MESKTLRVWVYGIIEAAFVVLMWVGFAITVLGRWRTYHGHGGG